MDQRRLQMNKAKRAKDDEFYTLYEDVEKEMSAYLEWNPDLFEGKTILMPCDNPETSQFARYFIEHPEFGYARLVAACIAGNRGIDSFSDEDLSRRGKMLDAELNDVKQKGIEIMKCWRHLKGDGSFESAEVSKLRDEADFIVTNPPFSLFSCKFAPWLLSSGKQFAVLANVNAVKYKNIFRLIQNDRLWLGTSKMSGGMWFMRPDGTKANVSSVWLTNIDHAKRHRRLVLKTEEENRRSCANRIVREVGYRRYDNYDAVDVPLVAAIPSDCNELMGVPMSFLDSYCPDQFEIAGIADGAGGSQMKEREYPFYKRIRSDKGGDPVIDGKRLFTRIIIRKRNIETNASGMERE